MNSSVSTIQKAERETTINFSVEIVKEAINTILEELPFKYSPVGKGKSNDVFNNYQFSISRNMNPAICNVYLEDAETDKTKIKIIVTNAYGAVSSNSILESILNDYLNLLAKVLKGDSIEAEKKKATTSGILWVLFIIIFIIIMGVIFLI
ncbi:MAG: hypothetical protein PHV04_04950 [Clostridia bacterium]|nr:hypothetical protein [Clostridia bacterium]